jgi:hypothetical protein
MDRHRARSRRCRRNHRRAGNQAFRAEATGSWLCAGGVFEAVGVALPPLLRRLRNATPPPKAVSPPSRKRQGRPRCGAGPQIGPGSYAKTAWLRWVAGSLVQTGRPAIFAAIDFRLRLHARGVETLNEAESPILTGSSGSNDAAPGDATLMHVVSSPIPALLRGGDRSGKLHRAIFSR